VRDEESTFRFLVACREPRAGPCLAVSPPQQWCGLPRPASREPMVDSSALQPVSHPASAAWAGLGMTVSWVCLAGARAVADAGSHVLPAGGDRLISIASARETAAARACTEAGACFGFCAGVIYVRLALLCCH
jgi:hypothetical protein